MIDDYQTEALIGNRYNPAQSNQQLGWAPS